MTGLSTGHSIFHHQAVLRFQVKELGGLLKRFRCCPTLEPLEARLAILEPECS